jgi:hypothetical protein
LLTALRSTAGYSSFFFFVFFCNVFLSGAVRFVQGEYTGDC